MSEQVSVKVAAETSALSAGLAQAKNLVDDFKHSAVHSIKEVAAGFVAMFAAEKIIEYFKEVSEEMDRVQKLALRFGESAESIQRVGEAAKLSGSDMETVSKAMVKVNSNAIEAIKGSGELGDSFNTLGINAKEFVDMPMEEKLLKLAEGYSEGTGSAEKMAAIMKVLGKGSTELIPMLSGGAEELKKLFENATVASQATVDSLAETQEKSEHFYATLKAQTATAFAYVLEWIEKVENAYTVYFAFVKTLMTDGYTAAKQAAKEASDEIEAAAAKAKAQREEKREKAKHGGSGDRIEEGKRAQDEAKELAKLEEENAKKKEDARLRSLSLAQREAEIIKQIHDLEGKIAIARASGKRTDELKADNERIDLQKELEKNEGEQQKERDSAYQHDLKEAQRVAKEKAKAETDAKKDELRKAEDTLHTAEHGRGVSIDSLRAIGGSIAGTSLNYAATKDDLQKQAVSLAKEQVEQLKRAVKALEDKNKVTTDSDGDGSFSLS